MPNGLFVLVYSLTGTFSLNFAQPHIRYIGVYKIIYVDGGLLILLVLDVGIDRINYPWFMSIFE